MLTAAMAVRGHVAKGSERFVDYMSFCWVTLRFDIHFAIGEKLKIHFHCLKNRKIMRFNFKFYLIIINFTIQDIGYRFLITDCSFLFKLFAVCFLACFHFFGKDGILD